MNIFVSPKREGEDGHLIRKGSGPNAKWYTWLYRWTRDVREAAVFPTAEVAKQFVEDLCL